MPPLVERVVHQNFFNVDSPPINIKHIREPDLSKDHDQLRSFLHLGKNDAQALGLAATYNESGGLHALAIAKASSVLLIEFWASKWRRNSRGEVVARDTTGREVLQEQVLCRPCGHLYAFDIGPLALSLWHDHGIRVTNAVDIQSAGSPKTRQPLASIRIAVGDNYEIHKDNINEIFDDVAHDPRNFTPLALRAWVSHHVSQLSFMEDRLAKVPVVHTTNFTDEVLSFLAKSTQDSFRLDQMKPTVQTHKFNTTWNDQKNHLKATADRYQNVIRKSGNQTVRVTVEDPSTAGKYKLQGTVANAMGSGANLALSGNLGGKMIGTITTIGRDGPTAADSARTIAILQFLQGKKKIKQENPWIERIWLMSDEFKWPEVWSAEPQISSRFNPKSASRPLNSSQTSAVEHMLSQTNDTRITLIQGPPGTGKTTVIASFVQAALRRGQNGIWLVAQSNVAVKNIAEKLADFGILDWKLFVSNDFIEFWHEHLYTDIRSNVILGDELLDPGIVKDLTNCRVILCTLSMLSKRALRDRGITRVVPLSTLVVDEASQIELGGYIPVFNLFTSIRKVCFIGDDKQLPPYGQEDIQDLKSVFEVEHLHSDTIFLDTQYRMPPQVGDFISQAIYDGKLQSNEFHQVTTDSMACYFVDVSLGQEESFGTSWKNAEECKAVLQIATILEAQQKSYRIITPYDAQRTTIEDDMKAADLSWNDKCFNVDSFQGNEDNYIVISLVRSKDLGFLRDLRRTNVMLTRCKRGMYIVTSRAFMEKAGKDSLVGSLLDYYDYEAWVDLKDLEKVI